MRIRISQPILLVVSVDFRKVQKAGYSTLTVSLPKDWVKELGIKHGDIVSVKREEDGTLRLAPGVSKEAPTHIKCVVDADLCAEPGLLSRIVTGIYIIGYDLVHISSKKALNKDHLAEIRSVSQRLSGIGIVEQSLNHITLQSFIDPGKFPVDLLLRRLCTIAAAMQSAISRALAQRSVDLANEVINMEDEVDKLYWLLIRQLVLAVRDRETRSETGIESPLHIVGNRVVANALESIADSCESIAREVLKVLGSEDRVDDVMGEISEFARFVQNIQERAVKALFERDIKLANAMIASIEEAEGLEREITEKIFTALDEEHRDAEGVSMIFGLRTIVWNFGEIARYSRIIAEVAINRTLEKPTQLCSFEEIELTKF